MRALLYETLIWLDRLYADAASPDTRAEKGHRNRYVDRFATLVEESFRRDHAVQSYANRLCITPNYLNEIVKEATGQSAKQYIHDKILIEAKRLLAYTDLPAGDLAYELGYETTSYFIRFFRSRTGMTPLSYRREQNNG